MDTTKHNTMSDELTPEMAAVMEQHGISRFPVYYYRFGRYKYSNLRDALAQAERERGTN